METILVDDGSDVRLDAAVPGDGKRLVVLRIEPNRGKGAAVRRGALAAKGGWVLMSDVDLSAPFAEFARLAPYADAWIVCGSRYGRPGMPLVRRFLSRAFHALVRLACGMDVQDTQCGFKLFRMDVMRAVFAAQRIERFAFDVELIRRARDAGTVKKFPSRGAAGSEARCASSGTRRACCGICLESGHVEHRARTERAQIDEEADAVVAGLLRVVDARVGGLVREQDAVAETVRE